MKYNPFNPNSIVSTNLFAGRKDYILQIIRKLEQVRRGMPSSFFLFGERGIGKTALAKLIKHIAEAKDPILGNLNYLTSYYTAEKDQPIGSILQSSLNELSDALPQTAIESLGKKLGSLFKNGKFSIGSFSYEYGTKEQEKMTSILKDQLVSILSNINDAIGLGNGGKPEKDGVLIIIDELQNVADLEKCAQLFRGIITTLDVKALGYISFLLIGYEEASVDFFEGDPSARRQFDSIRLDVMPLAEAADVMKKAFTEAEVKWDEEELTKNIIASGGYPHSIQLLGHNLLEVDKDNFIGADDWQGAIHRTALELQKKDFADLYEFEGKPTAKESILDILAVAGRPLTKVEINQFFGAKNIYQYVPDLKKRGSIKSIPGSDKLTLHSQLFRTSILLQILPKIVSENYLSDLAKKEWPTPA